MLRKEIAHAVDYVGKTITGFADVGNNIYFFRHLFALGRWTVLAAPFRYIFFPIALLCRAFAAISAWVDASANNYQGPYLLKALAETAATVATAVAAVGVLVGAAAFAFLGPLIYGAACAFGALVDTGLAIYYGVQIVRTKDPIEKAEYKAKAADHGVNAVLGGLMGGVIIAAAVLGGPAVDFAALMIGTFVIIASLAWTFIRAKLLSVIRADGEAEKNKQSHTTTPAYKKGSRAILTDKLQAGAAGPSNSVVVTAEPEVKKEDTPANVAATQSHEPEHDEGLVFTGRRL